MISWPSLVLCLLAGSMAGAFFFLGLQHTVNKAMVSERPGRLFFLSFVFRFSLMVPVFFVAARWGPFALLLCFLGFMLARQMVLRRARKGEDLAA